MWIFGHVPSNSPVSFKLFYPKKLSQVLTLVNSLNPSNSGYYCMSFAACTIVGTKNAVSGGFRLVYTSELTESFVVVVVAEPGSQGAQGWRMRSFLAQLEVGQDTKHRFSGESAFPSFVQSSGKILNSDSMLRSDFGC